MEQEIKGKRSIDALMEVVDIAEGSGNGMMIKGVWREGKYYRKKCPRCQTPITQFFTFCAFCGLKFKKIKGCLKEGKENADRR